MFFIILAAYVGFMISGITLTTYDYASIGLADPNQKQAGDTEWPVVTSSQPKYNNTFISTSNTSPYSTFALGNCTSDGARTVGLIVDKSSPTYDAELAVLKGTFDDINAAYKEATSSIGGGLALNSAQFTNNDEVNAYTTKSNYNQDQLCFAIGFNEFNRDSNKFDFNLRFGLINGVPNTNME